MQFTEKEIQFLIRPHKTETAHLGCRALSAAQDLRTLGCPAAIFNRVLEDRARRLGTKFVEFRNEQHVEQTQSVPATDLDVQIAASHPF